MRWTSCSGHRCGAAECERVFSPSFGCPFSGPPAQGTGSVLQSVMGLVALSEVGAGVLLLCAQVKGGWGSCGGCCLMPMQWNTCSMHRSAVAAGRAPGCCTHGGKVEQEVVRQVICAGTLARLKCWQFKAEHQRGTHLCAERRAPACPSLPCDKSFCHRLMPCLVLRTHLNHTLPCAGGSTRPSQAVRQEDDPLWLLHHHVALPEMPCDSSLPPRPLECHSRCICPPCVWAAHYPIMFLRVELNLFHLHCCQHCFHGTF